MAAVVKKSGKLYRLSKDSYTRAFSPAAQVSSFLLFSVLFFRLGLFLLQLRLTVESYRRTAEARRTQESQDRSPVSSSLAVHIKTAFLHAALLLLCSFQIATYLLSCYELDENIDTTLTRAVIM